MSHTVARGTLFIRPEENSDKSRKLRHITPGVHVVKVKETDNN
jgi:hypothetical protein